MFENGEGTEKQPIYAYINYLRAAAGGVRKAEERDAIKAHALSPATLRAQGRPNAGGK